MVAFATKPAPRKKHVVWSPLAGSQALAVGCPCDEILYHGSRGPGKTDAQLFAFRKNVGLGYGRFWRGIIFDEEYKNLDDLVEKSKRWFPQFNDGAVFKLAGKDYKWVWPTGEELLFRVGSKEEDYNAYHGHEYPFIGFNELTKQATSKFYYAIQSCNRSSFLPLEHSPDLANPLPEIPLVIFSTTNPHGVGHNWVKRDFIDKGPPGVVQRVTTKIYNPRTKQKEDVVKTRTHIFGTYMENRFLSPVYIATLHNQKDPNKKKAWLTGDWNIVAGGALDDVWDETIHVLPRFIIPKNWRIDRAFDWGSTHPFSVGWWAEANGEEVLIRDGIDPKTKKQKWRRFCPAAGSLIRFFEWYGCQLEEDGSPAIGTNEGLKMGPVAVANGIKEREQELFDDGWIETDVKAGPADNQIRAVNDEETETIEKRMNDNGVHWVESDKSAGSRKIGLELIRDRLTAARTGEGPAIYFMVNCRCAISTLPVLPRDVDKPDDVDTDSEDHIYDEVRYKVLQGNNRIATNLKVSHPK